MVIIESPKLFSAPATVLKSNIELEPWTTEFASDTDIRLLITALENSLRSVPPITAVDPNLMTEAICNLIG